MRCSRSTASGCARCRSPLHNGFLRRQKARLGGLFVFAGLFFLSFASFSQDYAREKRWADEILPVLMVGDAVWLQQKNGHKFLGLYIDKKENSKGAVIIAHGRGWSPDFELYGTMRTRLA